jgi:meso-butanediol dehydrogenase/(S,S)-butanediol dehydrogenase/diacetyl reductase
MLPDDPHERGDSMARFDRQVAIVTGSGSGIGRAIAIRLADEGAAVCVADIDADRAAATVELIRAAGGVALARETDVTDRSSVAELVSATMTDLGPVDVLVNNAALCGDTPLEELTEQQWDADVDVTLKGPFFCTQAVLPQLKARRRGVIVNIGSVNAVQYFGNDAYSAAKAGLASFTRSVAVQYGSYGIRAVMIAPGTVRTAAWDARLAADPQVLDRLTRWYPLGRVGSVDDIAAAAAFLASAEASWITGTVLTVDGGLLAGNAPMVQDILGS